MFKKFCDRCDREITKEDNVRSHTEKELLGFRRLGKGILAEIVDKLAERGRHLREEAA